MLGYPGSIASFWQQAGRAGRRRNASLAVMVSSAIAIDPVSYTHLRAHETVLDLVCRLLLEKKKHPQNHIYLSTQYESVPSRYITSIHNLPYHYHTMCYLIHLNNLTN